TPVSNAISAAMNGTAATDALGTGTGAATGLASLDSLDSLGAGTAAATATGALGPATDLTNPSATALVSDNGLQPVATGSSGGGLSSVSSSGGSGGSGGYGDDEYDEESLSSSSSSSSESVTKFITTATWFDSNEASSACDTTYSSSDYIAAISPSLFGSSNSPSSLCGAYLRVWQPDSNQTITVEIADECKDCPSPLPLSLSPSAFLALSPPPSSSVLKSNNNNEQAAKLDVGVLDVQWWMADQGRQGEIQYGFEEAEEGGSEGMGTGGRTAEVQGSGGMRGTGGSTVAEVVGGVMTM
ncbi:hypothetical protein JCM6882_001102, partial [Rhodosporidiobolus microsporus]